MDKKSSWLVLIVGILLLLPLIKVTQLEGAITDWVIAVAVVLIGVMEAGLIKK
jgi:hypothetical protein